MDQYANQTLAVLQAANSYTAATSATTDGLTLSDIASSISRMSKHGYNATHIFMNPGQYENLLKMADFATAFTTAQASVAIQAGGNVMPTDGANPFSSMLSTGVLVGSLYGLAVVVNAWVPSGRMGIFDLSVKPMAYVERRPLTVEEANPGFGIVGSYMSMRYGLKVVRPSVGAICINA